MGAPGVGFTRFTFVGSAPGAHLLLRNLVNAVNPMPTGIVVVCEALVGGRRLEGAHRLGGIGIRLQTDIALFIARRLPYPTVLRRQAAELLAPSSNHLNFHTLPPWV